MREVEYLKDDVIIGKEEIASDVSCIGKPSKMDKMIALGCDRWRIMEDSYFGRKCILHRRIKDGAY